jgi:hypothetical protein
MPRPKRILSGDEYISKTEKQVNLPKVYTKLPKTERMVNLPSIYYNKSKYAPSFLYKATGVGLSPNIDGLKFYDSGLIYNGKKSFYSEDGQYAIWYLINAGGSPYDYWRIGRLIDISVGTLTPISWGKLGITDTVTGDYGPGADVIGAVTISLI